MTVVSGTRLGPYEIVAPIGAGGMGEVYKARDTRLERTVAVKILPSEFANDSQLKLRFDREAKTISQLEHPHICRLYDVGEAASDPASPPVNFLVMELLDGESLADRIAKGPLRMSDVLRHGAEIADALARAHRAGIVHRDLKPGNVMITKSGAKLLDFGLAKSSTPRSSATAAQNEPSGVTALKPLTAEGHVVGTFLYMAPEQLAGDEADERTDIFALGEILYEMATGRRAFDGKTKTSLIAQIVGGEPRPIRELQPLTPASFEHVVQKCLAKEPEERWQSAQDIAAQLTWIRQGASDAAAAAPAAIAGKRRVSFFWPAAAALALVLAAILATILVRAHNEVNRLQRPVHFALNAPHADTVSDAAAWKPRISPDGRSILFCPDSFGVSTPLWVLSLDSAEPHQVTGTSAAWAAFWSPDGTAIAFFSGGKLLRVAASGGSPQTLADVGQARGGAWSGTGTIVFVPTPRANLRQVSVNGGPVTDAVPLDASIQEFAQRFPIFLPDQQHLIFLSYASKGGTDGVARVLYVAKLGSRERRKLTESDSGAAYAAGWLFFVRGNSLLRQRFDIDSLSLTGEVQTVAPDVQSQISIGSGSFSVSDDLLVYATGSTDSSFAVTQMGRDGKPLPGPDKGVGLRGLYDHLQLSPDGSSIVVDEADGRTGARNIWSIDLATGRKSRLSFGRAVDWIPTWSPDGKQVVWVSDRDGAQNMFIRSLAGEGGEKKLITSKEPQHHMDWSRDGRYIAYERNAPNAPHEDIWTYDTTTGQTRPIIATPAHEMYPRISPDSRWIAYAADESGSMEVYLQRFPEGGSKMQVSIDGGSGERWRGDGKELYFVSARGEMMAVSVTEKEGRLVVDAPHVLFSVPMVNNHSWDVSPDGSRFIAPIVDRRGPAPPLTAVLHWRTEAEK